MPHIAAIDVGSNAIRFALAAVDARVGLQRVHSAREPIRLGRDVFDHGGVRRSTVRQMSRAFARFSRMCRRHDVVRLRAVATSALREAGNRRAVIRRLQQQTGIGIELIDGRQEAQLIHRAVGQVIDLRQALALLIDIGGGSVETSVCHDGHIVATRSWPIGTVRLLQHLRRHDQPVDELPRLLDRPLQRVRHFLREAVGRQKIDLCVGTGGNAEALGKLRVSTLGQSSNRAVTAEDLDALLRKLLKRSVAQRVKDFDIRPDRADVIVPAAMLLRALLTWADCPRLQVPRVALKDGLLWELAEQQFGSHQAPAMASVEAA